jgi:hypothetical protein
MIRRAFALSILTCTLAGGLGATSARAEDALYEIVQKTPKVAVGATATASLTIKAKSGWHVNAEAPINLALTPPAGLSVKKAKLTRADLAATTVDSARFDIPISATEAGKQSIAAEARFVICQEQACKPVKETLALAVEVTPPAAAGPKHKSKKTE